MHSPASERNKAPILQALTTRIQKQGNLLELACGSLQHAQHIAPQFSEVTWYPTDISANALEHGLTLKTQNQLPKNVEAPFFLDATELPWGDHAASTPNSITTLYTANLLHISPIEVCAAVFSGSQKILTPDGKLFIYGPFKLDGKHTAASNADFDQSLKTRNPLWGIRDLEHIEQCAQQNSLRLLEALPMPANNFLLSFNFC